MKILMINVVCGIRSTGRICTDLATELENQGHEVKIAYGRFEVPEKFQKFAVKIGSNFDVKLHALKARLFDACGFGSKKATEKFIDFVKDFNPDLIHLHNIHGYYLNVEVLFNYLKTSGKKIIWTLHDCWAFTGHTAYCDAFNCEKWRNGCGNCPGLKDYPKSFLDRSASNWKRKKKLFCGVPDMTIITPSKWLAELVKKSFLSEYPVHVIHNGIDTEKFYPMKNDFRDFYKIGDKFILLGVATAWDEMKGLSDYIKLADKLGENYQVVLVGLSPEQIAKLPKNILGIERTNSVKELSYIYSAADLYVNLSYSESFGLTNLEALACGTPVITYNSGGSPESAQGGIVVPKGDIDSAAREIKKFQENNNVPNVNIDRDSIDGRTTMKNYLTVIGGGYRNYKNSLGLLGKTVILGVAATWNEKRKGLSDYLKLAEILDEKYKIILVGLTKNQKNKLPEKILGIERTNNIEELAKIYSAADLFVNFSYSDNYPTVNLEAVACGTPVLTYNSGGSPESALNGIVIPRGDLEAAVKEIKNYFDGKNKPEIIFDRSEFDHKKTLTEYLKLIRSEELGVRNDF